MITNRELCRNLGICYVPPAAPRTRKQSARPRLIGKQGRIFLSLCLLAILIGAGMAAFA